MGGRRQTRDRVRRRPLLALFLTALLAAGCSGCSDPAGLLPPADTAGTTDGPPHAAGSTTVPAPSSTSTTTTPTTTSLPPELQTRPRPAGALWEGADLLSVTDGDTLQVEAPGCDEGLRLIGVNAPEEGECLAAEATAFLASLVEGADLALLRDVSDHDQHGRCLRYLWAGDIFVNEALARSGLAIASRYPPDVAYASLFAAAQTEAQGSHRGMWLANACGPATGAVVTISAIDYDPPGDDTLDLTAEQVTLTNASWAPLDLTGWVLKDQSATHRYRFPDGFVLLGGHRVTVHTGSGQDSSEDLYWGHSGSGIWNNDGDTVYLLDPSGNIATSQSYP